MDDSNKNEIGSKFTGMISIGAIHDGTIDLTVYKPEEQSIALLVVDLPMIIDSLIEREALIRHNRLGPLS